MLWFKENLIIVWYKLYRSTLLKDIKGQGSRMILIWWQHKINRRTVNNTKNKSIKFHTLKFYAGIRLTKFDTKNNLLIFNCYSFNFTKIMRMEFAEIFLVIHCCGSFRSVLMVFILRIALGGNENQHSLSWWGLKISNVHWVFSHTEMVTIL